MEQKREEARRAAEARRQAADAEASRRAAAAERAREVMPWLKRLGFRDDEIRRAAALCDLPPEATLEERVRLALSHLGSGKGYMRRATSVS
jgi:Holliday junction resolvasome RuvABC DNA-binding subunit